MINQTLWNATAEVTEKKKGDQGSILENRKEVEEVRQELLDRISGSASHRARNMGLPEALQWQEERDLSLVGNGSSSVEVSTTNALESVDVAT